MPENWEIHWKDYYSILQVHPEAELEVIKAAYARLARKYHPDVNLDYKISARMAEINEAYEVLSDPERREEYDSAWLLEAKAKVDDGQKSSKPERHFAIIIPKWWILLTISLVIVVVVIVVLNLSRESLSPLINPSSTLTTTSDTPYNLKIESVILQENAKISSGDLLYEHTVKIRNYESFNVRIYWEATSSLIGLFDSGYISVRDNYYREFTRSYSYLIPGIEEVTYTLYWGNVIIDTLSMTHEITE